MSSADLLRTGAFLAAAVWGGQCGGQICIWGTRIPDDIIIIIIIMKAKIIVTLYIKNVTGALYTVNYIIHD